MSTTTDPIAAPRLGYPMRIVFDPELAGEVLVADAASYTRPWLVTSTMRDGLGRTLFTATGAGALAQRRLLAPVFARAHGDELAGLMSATIDDELARWPAGPIADLQGPLTDLTLRVAARALLGVDTGDDDRGRRLRDEFSIVIEWINHRFNRLFSPPAIVPTPRNRAMLRARSELRTIVHRVIADRRATKASSMDVLALLLDHQARTGDLSDDHIVNECIGFLFAGHETTASTLAWALYSLAVAPEMQQRVAAEGDALQGRPSAAAVDALHYTGQVVEETLRLYPAGVGIARMARCATTLAGQRIRRGTIVAIPVYSIQRDPRRWTAPDTFDPDRFRAGAVSPRGGHLPFGWGPRACLGARFATMEARLALTMITARWRVTFTGERAPEQKISSHSGWPTAFRSILKSAPRQGQAPVRIPHGGGHDGGSVRLGHHPAPHAGNAEGLRARLAAGTTS
ncbi:MAG TPA: cytochrome P450 [Acidimicrobiia bacterium]|nr:cytochrome P450 [Acidimicrobiia bacterium]